ncbi:hypothetical protein KM043_012040 [Ampulex compressa]|nr:hypothetical protein KM043_012040 [Ampulex compressa]
MRHPYVAAMQMRNRYRPEFLLSPGSALRPLGRSSPEELDFIMRHSHPPRIEENAPLEARVSGNERDIARITSRLLHPASYCARYREHSNSGWMLDSSNLYDRLCSNDELGWNELKEEVSRNSSGV